MLSDIAAVVITADSVRDGIDQNIKDDLIKQCGFKLIFEKKCQISNQQVSEIYPKLVREIFFPALVYNMTLGPSILLLYKGSDIYKELKEAKGVFKFNGHSIDKTGLRFKYQGPSEKELVDSGCQAPQFLYRLFEFRLHTTDNLEETISLCKTLLPGLEYTLLMDSLKLNRGT